VDVYVAINVRVVRIYYVDVAVDVIPFWVCVVLLFIYIYVDVAVDVTTIIGVTGTDIYAAIMISMLT